MRRDEQVRDAPQRARGWKGLLIEHVEGRAAERPFPQGLCQRRLVDDAAARHVHQLCAGFHGGDRLQVQKSLGLGRSRQDHDHDVRLLQYPSRLRGG
jgi:hypothetical protein